MLNAYPSGFEAQSESQITVRVKELGILKCKPKSLYVEDTSRYVLLFSNVPQVDYTRTDTLCSLHGKSQV